MVLAFVHRMISAASLAPSQFPDVGSEQAPGERGPAAIDISHDELMRSLNPLQHLPGVGMLYRAATGETIPAPLRVLGAGIVGGPLGMLAAGFMGIIEKIVSDGPDQSRPATVAGMAATGSEAGMQPITPGSLSDGAYTTLATVQPDWLGGSSTRFAAGTSAYQTAEMVEKGLA